MCAVQRLGSQGLNSDRAEKVGYTLEKKNDVYEDFYDCMISILVSFIIKLFFKSNACRFSYVT